MSKEDLGSAGGRSEREDNGFRHATDEKIIAAISGKSLPPVSDGAYLKPWETGGKKLE